MKVQRLFPTPVRDVSEVYEDLDLPPSGRRDPTRPYVIVNMISSVDGRIAIGGKSGRIGSRVDRQAMRTLRSKADAVMVGAGTLRAEHLSLGLDEEGGAQPLAIIVTSTGNVPLKENLILTGDQEVLVVLADEAPGEVVDRARELASVMRSPADAAGVVDLERVLQNIRVERDVELLLVEGGPRLNHALVSLNLVDELFLTVAPKLLGGTAAAEGLTLLGEHGPLVGGDQTLQLLSIHLADNELFLRYALTGRRTTAG